MPASFYRNPKIIFFSLVSAICFLLFVTHQKVHSDTTNQSPVVTSKPVDAATDTLSVTFANPIPTNNVMDVEIIDTNNTKVWQKFSTNGGTSFTESVSLPAGVYKVNVGLFTPNWGSNYAWFSNVATIILPNTISPTPTPALQKPVVSVTPAGDFMAQITVTYATPVPVNNIADIEVYNSSHMKVWQNTSTLGGTTFHATTTILPAGAYSVSVGLFTPNWGSNYQWFDHMVDFTLPNTVTSSTSSTPTPTASQANQPVVVSGVSSETYTAAMSAYADWKGKYVQSYGNGARVVRPENNNDTVSEGMGYGMLLSVFASDKQTFQNLWSYTQKYLDGKGLMQWQISKDGVVIGSGSATDADEDIAYALVKASTKWPGEGYDSAARNMIQAIAASEINNVHLVTPGDQWGATSAVNPSYIALGYYPSFAAITGDGRWNDVLNASNVFLSQISQNPTGLVPDWINSNVTPSNISFDTHQHDFWYDAVRTPIRLLHAYKLQKNDTARAILQKQNNFFASISFPTLVSGYSLSGMPLTSYLDSTFQAAYAAVGQVDPKSIYANTSLSSLIHTAPATYFGTSLRALTLFFASGQDL